MPTTARLMVAAVKDTDAQINYFACQLSWVAVVLGGNCPRWQLPWVAFVLL